MARSCAGNTSQLCGRRQELSRYRSMMVETTLISLEQTMTTLVISTDAPAVAGPPQGRWTYADWEQLPEDGNRYEIIDGALYMTTAPSSFHQWIVQELVEYIGIPAKNQSLAYAFPAPICGVRPGLDLVHTDFV